MKFTRDQKINAYKNLPEDVQSIVMDPEVSDTIENLLLESNINEEVIDECDSEILYAMYGLQSLSDAIVNISKLSNKKIEDLLHLKSELYDRIFNKIEQIQKEKLFQNYYTSSGIAEKIDSLCNKYGIEEEKRGNLVEIIYNCLLDKKYNISSEELSEKIGISNLKAEQVSEELNTKILPNIKISDFQNSEPKEKPGTDTANKSEKVESSKEIGVPTYSPPSITLSNNEPVQKPVPVPRFVGVSGDTGLPTSPIKPFVPVKKVETLNIIEAKLNKPSSAPSENKEQQMPTTKYSTDPYREPLE